MGTGDAIALVAAMETELAHALRQIEDLSPARLGPWRVFRGRVRGRPVTAMAVGIGLVNAAAALAALMTAERVAAVLNFGCAGAHRRDILPGDVVVGTSVVAYGSVLVLPDGTERYAGFRWDLDGETVKREALAADPELIAAALDAAQEWQPDPWPWAPAGARDPRVHAGVVASADCWTQHLPRIAALHGRHGSLCEEMEAAALAQVAAFHGVPFLAIKDISNNELLTPTLFGTDGSGLRDRRHELGARSFALTQRIVQRLAASAAAS